MADPTPPQDNNPLVDAARAVAFSYEWRSRDLERAIERAVENAQAALAGQSPPTPEQVRQMDVALVTSGKYSRQEVQLRMSDLAKQRALAELTEDGFDPAKAIQDARDALIALGYSEEEVAEFGDWGS